MEKLQDFGADPHDGKFLACERFQSRLLMEALHDLINIFLFLL